MTATYANPANQIAALKELYDEDSWVMKNEVYMKNPWLAMIPKDEGAEGFAGKYFPCPVVYGNPMGRSATFATAQSNQTAPLDVSFFIYRASNYQLITITNELLEATKGSAGAFVDQLEFNRKTAYRNLSNDLAADLFGNGTGVRGSISTISTGLITLTNANAVVQFEVGMVLQAFDAALANQVTANAVAYIIAVNRSAGTVTVSATAGGSAGTPTNWSSSFPALIQQGDYVVGQATPLKVIGLAGWLPTTAPTSTAFWGVDRSVDVTRLGGVRFDGSSETIKSSVVLKSSLIDLEVRQDDRAQAKAA